MTNFKFSDLHFTLKDVIGYGSVCFAISGLYYKTIITDIERDKQQAQKDLVTTQEINSLKESIKVDKEEINYLKQQIRILQDNDLKRSTIESSGGYVPLKKK